MELTSPAFTDGSSIPLKYTGDGTDVSPPLEWSDIPSGTKSFAIICDDPDAPSGSWVHWVIYNIPPAINSLPEGIAPVESPDDGIVQGINDFGRIGYGGPMPPRGTHRYVFKIFALDAILPSKPGITKAGLLKLMSGHIISDAKLTGKYSRS